MKYEECGFYKYLGKSLSEIIDLIIWKKIYEI